GDLTADCNLVETQLSRFRRLVQGTTRRSASGSYRNDRRRVSPRKSPSTWYGNGALDVTDRPPRSVWTSTWRLGRTGSPRRARSTARTTVTTRRERNVTATRPRSRSAAGANDRGRFPR